MRNRIITLFILMLLTVSILGIFGVEPQKAFCTYYKTFGETTKLPNPSYIAKDYLKGIQFPLSENATLFSISMYIKRTATAKVKFAVYSDNAGYPNQLIAYTNEWTAPSGWDNWKTLNLTTNPFIQAGYYWLCFLCDTSVALIHYVNYGEINQEVTKSYTYGAFPSAFPQGGTLDDFICSIYCSYGAHNLTINSFPEGVSFTLNESSEETPYSDWVANGTYTINFSSSIEYGGKVWTFLWWDDNHSLTDSYRIIDLQDDMDLLAIYEEQDIWVCNYVFTGLSYDGYIYKVDSGYSTTRNSLTGTVANGIVVGQNVPGLPYYGVMRGYVFFDTSSIPYGANITASKLSLYVEEDESLTEFNITIQYGGEAYPHAPLQSSDYYYSIWSGNGGNKTTYSVVEGKYWNITLNAQGISWIKTATGLTKFCLRSSRDIDAVSPSGSEWVGFKCREQGLSTAPKLYINYTYTRKYDFYGVYDEDTGLLNPNETRAVNVTAYFTTPGTPTYTFTLNGSYSYAPSNQPLYFRFAFPKPREYWVVPTEKTATIYAFKTTTTTYIITILDLAQVLKECPYVLVKRYINGTLYTVEKRKADFEDKVMVNLKQNETYTIFLGSDSLSYVYGDILTTPQPNFELILKGVNFPKEILMIYKYVRIYGYRTFLTPIGKITLMYEDILSQTLNVWIEVRYRNGTVIATYNITAQSFVFAWESAQNDTDYWVEVTIFHSKYGTLPWEQFFPRTFSEAPWGLDWLGKWEVFGIEIDTSIIFPIILILAVAGCFSVLNVEIGAFSAVIMAIIFTSIGWIDIPPAMLIVAFGLTILLALVIAKRRLIY